MGSGDGDGLNCDFCDGDDWDDGEGEPLARPAPLGPPAFAGAGSACAGTTEWDGMVGCGAGMDGCGAAMDGCGAAMDGCGAAMDGCGAAMDGCETVGEGESGSGAGMGMGYGAGLDDGGACFSISSTRGSNTSLNLGRRSSIQALVSSSFSGESSMEPSFRRLTVKKE